MKPSGPWFAWFASATMPAHCGEPALVPPTKKKLGAGNSADQATSTPPSTAALYETSGMARMPRPRPAWNEGTPKKRLGEPPPATDWVRLPPFLYTRRSWGGYRPWRDPAVYALLDWASGEREAARALASSPRAIERAIDSPGCQLA